MAKEIAELKQSDKNLRDAHSAAQTAVEQAELKLRKAEMGLETATALAQKSLVQTMQGKLSVSVLAPSVKVSFGNTKDMHVMPDAPKELIHQVLKTQVLPTFCKVRVALAANRQRCEQFIR